METNRQKLWTTDFSIITLGSIVSLMGNAASCFALGLLVLDYTGSILLYAVFLVCCSLPRAMLPILAGPYLDRFSRKRAIFSLDFLSAGLYLIVFLLLRADRFSYAPLLLLAMLIGSVESVYTVAYDTLYPQLVSDGNLSRAYAVSAAISSLVGVAMVPIVGICYAKIGLAPLFLFNACAFFIAAVAETRIQASETHLAKRADPRAVCQRFFSDLKDGFAYLKREKGLSAIARYFFGNTLTGAVCGTLLLPYFKSLPGGDGLMTYAFLMAVNTLGRLVGGAVNGRRRIPAQRKLLAALIIYIALSLLEGGYLFLPKPLMLMCMFLAGLLALTSYNIRVSGTQSYVPDGMRGRFNGLFQMLSISGGVLGQLLAGVMGDALPIRLVVAGTMLVNLIFTLVILLPKRRFIEPIYNVEV